MRMLTKKIFVVGLIAALSLVLLCASTLNEFYQPIVSLDSAKAFEVKPGDSLAVIASNLVNDRILVSPTMFRFVAWWRGVEALLQAGEYQFGPGESQADILQMLVDGEVRQYRITFVEGWRFSDVLDSLSSAEGLVSSADAEYEQFEGARASAGRLLGQAQFTLAEQETVSEFRAWKQSLNKLAGE